MSFMREARKSLTTKLFESGLLRSKGFIAGEWVPAASGKLLVVLDPATGSAVEHVPAMGAEDTKRAVSAAVESFDAWKGRTMPVRYCSILMVHMILFPGGLLPQTGNSPFVCQRDRADIAV